MFKYNTLEAGVLDWDVRLFSIFQIVQIIYNVICLLYSNFINILYLIVLL